MPTQVFHVYNYEYRWFPKGNQPDDNGNPIPWGYVKGTDANGNPVTVNFNGNLTKPGKSVEFATITNALDHAANNNYQLPPFPYTIYSPGGSRKDINYPNVSYGAGGDLTQEFTAFLQGCGVEPVFVEGAASPSSPAPQAAPVPAQPVQQQTPVAPTPVSQVQPQPLPTAPVPVSPVVQVPQASPVPVATPQPVQPVSNAATEQPMAAMVDVAFDNTADMLTAQTLRQAKAIQQGTNLDLSACIEIAQKIAVSALIQSSR